jgi:hypothetical protein
MGPDEAQNQEWLCWRGPVAIYCAVLEAVRCETVGAGKDVNTEAEEPTLLRAVTKQRLVKTYWEDIVCCSEVKSSPWISKSVIITCGYYLQVFNKSDYQTKPRVCSLTCYNISKIIFYFKKKERYQLSSWQRLQSAIVVYIKCNIIVI